MSDVEESESDSDTPSRVLKTPYDVQRMKLEKLMKNPTKPVVIPERPKDKKSSFVPDFVRNVMGSSAGAGSGEFHVYRHLRRKEYSRQKAIAEMSEKERLDHEFEEKMLENQRKAEERTVKKRAKRLRKKTKRKRRQKEKKMKTLSDQNDKTDSDSTSSDEDNDDDDGNLTKENGNEKQEGCAPKPEI